MNIRPLDVAKGLFTPAFFMVGDKDTMTLPRKVKVMYEQYGSTIKEFTTFEGEHASGRPVHVVKKAAEFLDKLWEVKRPGGYKDGLLHGIEESIVVDRVDYKQLTKYGDDRKPY